MKVLIASVNPVKVQAVREAFSSFFKNVNYASINFETPEHIHVNQQSQPIGEKETFQASEWRVRYSRRIKPDFDYYVGIEGGIAETQHKNYRIIAYSSVGNRSTIVTVRGCEIPLPTQWYNKLNKNSMLELGDLVTELSGIPNIKQKQGAVGFMTKNVVKRADILKHSVIMALIPFLQPRFFDENH